MKITNLLFVLFLMMSTQSRAQSDAWTVNDILHTEYVGNATFSPNGQKVVWTKRIGSKEKDAFISKLFITHLDIQKDGKYRTVQLTTGEESDYSPRFSKDGETIYFLSGRDKGKKLWSMSLLGGEPTAVHEFKNGISGIQWLSAHEIAYLSNDGQTLYDAELEKNKDNSVVIEDEEHWTKTRVYKFNIETKQSTRLTNNTHQVAGYKISNDGKYLVYFEELSLHYGVDGQPKPRYYLQNLATGVSTEILQGLQSPGNFQFTKDNTGFYFQATLSSNPQWNGAGIEELYYFDLAKNSYVKIPINWELGIGYSIEPMKGGVLVSLANKTTYKLAYLHREGANWKRFDINSGEKTDHISMLSVDESAGKALIAYSTASKLPAYFTTDLAFDKKSFQLKNLKEFVDLNPALKKKPTARTEVVTWKGYNNDDVTGILYYPTNYEAGKKYPFILNIHGGPSAADLDEWQDSWAYAPQIYTQKGAFVLMPNYHGSSNHGLDFVEAIKGGKYYDPELEDLIKGITHFSNKGLVDMNKLGSIGWSNGAILTTMLTVRYPDMFKAAAPGAGDVNWTSDYGTCEFGVTFDQSYLGGAPWDDVDGKKYNPIYIEKSPLFEMDKVKTPTLIFHGSEDRAVPRDQGWEYYRALQQNKKAPVRFIWFPGQPHGLQKITHQTRKLTEEINWFDKYLFQKDEPTNEAFKKESPLAFRLALDTLSQTDNKFGIAQSGALLPQVVSLGKDTISMGLFEVTNAQYKSFDTNFSYGNGEDNVPVRGLSKNSIEAYLQWLSKLTGSRYRLPNAKEAEALHKHGAQLKDENTLNYWAGYELSLPDAEKLKQELKKVKHTLFKPVGSFKASTVGAASLYDVGGNVAEYYWDGSNLKTYGYSAYDFVDAFNSSAQSKTEHTGFRVVKE